MTAAQVYKKMVDYLFLVWREGIAWCVNDPASSPLLFR